MSISLLQNYNLRSLNVFSLFHCTQNRWYTCNKNTTRSLHIIKFLNDHKGRRCYSILHSSVFGVITCIAWITCIVAPYNSTNCTWRNVPRHLTDVTMETKPTEGCSWSLGECLNTFTNLYDWSPVSLSTKHLNLHRQKKSKSDGIF